MGSVKPETLGSTNRCHYIANPTHGTVTLPTQPMGLRTPNPTHGTANPTHGTRIFSYILHGDAMGHVNVQPPLPPQKKQIEISEDIF